MADYKLSYTGDQTDEALGKAMKAVLTEAQNLTPVQQEQVRKNIGAGTSDFSGDYNDLENKPDLTGLQTQVTQQGETISALQWDVVKNAGDISGLKTSVETLQEALGGLSFAVNEDDGGLDITYTYTETEG